MQLTALQESLLGALLGQRVLRKGQGTELSLDGCGQSLEGLLERAGLILVVQQGAFGRIACIGLTDGQLNLMHHIEVFLIPLVQMLGIEIDIQRLITIDELFLEKAIRLVGGVELQALHGLTGQDMGLEHLDLVLDTG